MTVTINIEDESLLCVLIDHHRSRLEWAFKDIMEAHDTASILDAACNFDKVFHYHHSLMEALKELRKENK